MNFAGLPPTTVHGSTFLKTQALAPTTAPSPIMTPMPINASAATQTLQRITIDFTISSCFGEQKLCEAAHRVVPCDTVTSSSRIILAML